MTARIQQKLTGSPPHSTTWVRILENGDFEVEYYDYLCDEDSPFSHDWAIINRVKQEYTALLKRLLTGSDSSSDEVLLEAVVQRFPQRSDVEEWCKTNNVPCEHIYDPYA